MDGWMDIQMISNYHFYLYIISMMNLDSPKKQCDFFIRLYLLQTQSSQEDPCEEDGDSANGEGANTNDETAFTDNNLVKATSYKCSESRPNEV